MNQKDIEQIISNQELIIAMLHDLKQEQPSINIAEVAKKKEYRGY